MIPNTTWKPEPEHLEWQKNLVRMLTDSATWAVPGTASIFQINKSLKTFELTTGDPNDEGNRRIAKVFKQIGFSEKITKTNDATTT
jgi:hypothetical protein